jgi:hypothetical protein
VYERLGDEFSVLRTIPIEQIEAAGFPLLALAIRRMRAHEVVLDPGFDGVFGTIKVFQNAEDRAATLNQLSLL